MALQGLRYEQRYHRLCADTGLSRVFDLWEKDGRSSPAPTCPRSLRSGNAPHRMESPPGFTNFWRYPSQTQIMVYNTVRAFCSNAAQLHCLAQIETLNALARLFSPAIDQRICSRNVGRDCPSRLCSISNREIVTAAREEIRTVRTFRAREDGIRTQQCTF